MKTLCASPIDSSLVTRILVVSISIALSASWLMMGQAAIAAEPVSMNELLEQVKQGRGQDAAANKQRIEEFSSNKTQQVKRLQETVSSRVTEEEHSKSLELAFEENDKKITESENALNERLGDLKELFGVLQVAAAEASGQFESSLTHVQYPGRPEFATNLAQKLGTTGKLVSIEEIEQFWFELQREMIESGKTVKFEGKVITTDGEERDQSVTRVGLFNTVSNGKYLTFNAETGSLSELSRDPQTRYIATISGVESTNSGIVPFGLDVSRGQILSRLVRKANLQERIEQGGIIGYIILGLGAFALLIAIWRLLVLFFSSVAISGQTRKLDKPSKGNALGRVIQVYHNHPKADLETMELRLDEAVMKETPKFTRFLVFIKIIAVAAPLLGLLGTVTGMINTFQAITLFGTGDPQVMAGGISQALVTTVLGLVVAIPAVLLFSLASGRAKRLSQVLEEQAVGMIAEHSEKRTAVA
ncbi:MAG: MotA/TolQ/ExbB proton channel family protein [Gammaproteobacteria bacterium]|nr:MotA/TolQ/ExbB proton channel family protein [Gammaproteobacteria bacterium]